MTEPTQPPPVPTDALLLQIVDQALANTAARSGEWLVCRPGCSQCCHGAFAIHALDAARLRAGLEDLRRTDTARALRVDARARLYVEETRSHFPGDAGTGVLGSDQASVTAFEEFENERACPVLDPSTQTCDLYAARPMTCRVFGPPVRNEDGLGVCELCYMGATPEQVESCEMVPDPDGLEDDLLAEMVGVKTTVDARTCYGNDAGDTIIAYALARSARVAEMGGQGAAER